MLELLERHGPSGPHSFTVLLGEAAAGVLGRDAIGHAELSWAEFGHFAGIPVTEVRARLRELAESPFSLVEIVSAGEWTFRVRLVRWEEWDKMPKDRTGAERSARHRAKKKAGEDEPSEEPEGFDPITGGM